MSRPLVSICVPTRNRAGFLRQSLETICRQTYEPLEILIADNASTDETPELCRQLESADPRVRYLRHETNIGLYANHNFCIRASRGSLFCFFHDDDLYRPSIVNEYVDFLQQHPGVGLVCADWDLIDDGGARIGSRVFRGRSVLPGLHYVERTLRSGRSSLGCSGTMVRRSALGDVRFDETGPVGFGDFVVWCTVAETSSVGHISETLWSYRIHRGSLSRRTVLEVTKDYRTAMSGYCQGRRRRHPDQALLTARWEAMIDRFLFWALLYEVGRHVRRQRGTDSTQTIFDCMGYTLDPAELEEVLALLKAHQRGVVRPAVRWGAERLLRAGKSAPLAWMTSWAPWLREAFNRR